MRANPVIVKELRGRMRGWRAVVVLTIYLLVLSFITWLVYGTSKGFSSFSSPESQQVGKFIFFGLVGFQAIMVALLTPAFTAGSITSEREQKTYDLLLTTLLRPRTIIFGKLGSALAYMLLLVLAVAPIESMAFMFGGVSPEEIVISQVVMVVSGVLYASVGIFWSSILRSSIASNVLTYGTLLLPLIFVPFISALSQYGSFFSVYGGNGPPSGWDLYMGNIFTSLNPLVAMISTESDLTQGLPYFMVDRQIPNYNYTSVTPGITAAQTVTMPSAWIFFCIEALVISAILVLIAIRRVQPVHYRSRMPKPSNVPVEVAPPAMGNSG